MGNVRAHADHVHVHVAEEDDVARKVRHRLAGQRAHDARPDLVAAAAQGRKALDAARPAVVRRMEARIEFRRRRFDAQQIARRARRAPAPVDVFLLLAKRKRHTEVEVRDGAQAVLDEGRVRLALDLAALEDEGGVARPRIDFGHAQDVRDGEAIAVEGRVRTADAAVETVLCADVADLDEAAHRDARPRDAALLRVGGRIDGTPFGGILQRDKARQVVHGEVARTRLCAGENLFEGGVHESLDAVVPVLEDDFLSVRPDGVVDLLRTAPVGERELRDIRLVLLLEDGVAAGRHARTGAHVVRRHLHDVVAERRRLARRNRHAALRKDDAEGEHHHVDILLRHLARRHEAPFHAAEARKGELHLRFIALLHQVEGVRAERSRLGAPRRETEQERAAERAETRPAGAQLRPEPPFVAGLRSGGMEIAVPLGIVRLLEAGERFVARLEHRPVALLALRRDFEGEVREHLLEKPPHLAEALHRVDARILARDDEQAVDARRADRLGLPADLVERQVAAHGALVLDAEVAVAAGVDARVADVERRVDAHRLAVVLDAGETRLLPHRVHERIGGGGEEVRFIMLPL